MRRGIIGRVFLSFAALLLFALTACNSREEGVDYGYVTGTVNYVEPIIYDEDTVYMFTIEGDSATYMAWPYVVGFDVKVGNKLSFKWNHTWNMRVVSRSDFKLISNATPIPTPVTSSAS